MLTQLKEYGQRLVDPPSLGYGERTVRYEIHLDRSGEPEDPEPYDLADVDHRNGQRRIAPLNVRSSDIAPRLLADNATYTFGPGKRHGAYMKLLSRYVDATDDKRAAKVLYFLESDPLAKLHLPKDFDPKGAIEWRVDQVRLVDLPSVQSFWAALSVEDHRKGNCLLCGKEGHVLRKALTWAKGLPNEKMNGTPLVSVNFDAGSSYGGGWQAGNASLCAECERWAALGLTDLLRNKASHVLLGDTKTVFWTRTPTDFDLLHLLDRPDPEHVRALIQSVHTGAGAADVDAAEYYCASLSGTQARLAVHGWIETTVGEIKRNVAQWYEDMRVPGFGGQPARPLGIWALLNEAAKPLQGNKREKPTGFAVAAMMRGALAGDRLPVSYLVRLLNRVAAGEGITERKAAALRLTHNRISNRERIRPMLEENRPSSAYQCGRLFAILEAAQRYAVPSARATIKDRMFVGTMRTPGHTFPVLLANYNAHLTKVKNDKPGIASWLEKSVGEIMGRISAFPRHLNAYEQNEFVLGYYFQNARESAAEDEPLPPAEETD